ncbi:hypothetical protein T06_2626 [Trichinella sp. T6]|nr:hypothetical protein T06_2626 [Trichinella sp. T6]
MFLFVRPSFCVILSNDREDKKCTILETLYYYDHFI